MKQWAISIGAGLAFAFVVWVCPHLEESHETRPVIVYQSSPGEMIQNAPPDGVAEVMFTIIKVRAECVTIPRMMQLEVIDADNLSHFPNQRTGIPNDLPLGEVESHVRFEVPRLAISGASRIVMHGGFLCKGWRKDWVVRHSLPPIPMIIEE